MPLNDLVIFPHFRPACLLPALFPHFRPACLLPALPVCLLLALCWPLQAQELTAATPKNINENIDTINNYYRQVQDKLKGAPAQSAQPAAMTDPQTVTTLTQNRAPGPRRNAAAISSQNHPVAGAYTPAGRDPFALTPVMLQNEHFNLKQKVEFTPVDANLRLPNMRLKGVVTGAGADDALTALLEIDGLGVFVVREGDSVGLQAIGNGHEVVLIESISRLSLVVRTGSYGGNTEKRFVIR